MSPLADLAELVGFFAYSREDDEDSRGALPALRDAIQRELGAQLVAHGADSGFGRTMEAIAPGPLWESEIKTAVEQSVFSFPLSTPRAVSSNDCLFEFEVFLARERGLGRSDLVFPILSSGFRRWNARRNGVAIPCFQSLAHANTSIGGDCGFSTCAHTR